MCLCTYIHTHTHTHIYTHTYITLIKGDQVALSWNREEKLGKSESENTNLRRHLNSENVSVLIKRKKREITHGSSGFRFWFWPGHKNEPVFLSEVFSRGMSALLSFLWSVTEHLLVCIHLLLAQPSLTDPLLGWTVVASSILFSRLQTLVKITEQQEQCPVGKRGCVAKRVAHTHPSYIAGLSQNYACIHHKKTNSRILQLKCWFVFSSI